MNLGQKFKNKTFLITGASGFIAGRIIERLCRDYDCPIKALVHNIGHAARIARFNIEIIPGDILDKKLLEKTTQNVDYVIHCAVGNTPDIKLNHQITVSGTKNILGASLKNKVKRLIYFSTMSVYGYPLPLRINEKTPYKKVTGDHYNNDKIDAEKICRKYIKEGLPVVILQPTIVYGPYAKSWTLGPINEIKDNRVFLVDNGQGIANPVYIDNLIDAVFLSLTKKQAIGKTFIISNGKGITWKNFYSAYQKMISSEQPALPKFSLFNQYKLKILSLPVVLPIKLFLKIKKFYNPLKLFKTQPAFLKQVITPLYQKSQSIKNLSADKNRQLFFQDKALFKIKKVEKILSYSPRISFSQGMKLTEKWLKYARHLTQTKI